MQRTTPVILQRSREQSPLDVLLLPAEPGSEAWKRQRRSQVLTLLGACVVSFFIAIGAPSIELSAESRLAESVREMAESGDILIPHLNGEPCLAIPPLYVWLGWLASFAWGDVTAASVRFPSALAGVALVLLAYAAGRRLWGPATGFVAGMTLLSTYCVCRVARTGTPEMLLAVIVFLGIMAMLELLPRPRLWLGVAFALSMLAGGPLGPIVLLIFGMAFSSGEGRWTPVRSKGELVACVAGVGVGLLWYLAASLRLNGLGPPVEGMSDLEYLWVILAGTGMRPRPSWYYLERIWTDMAPWIYLAPLLIVGYMRLRRKLPMTPQISGLTWGVLGTLVYLSVLPFKQFQSQMLVCPVLALMFARGLRLAESDRRMHIAFDVVGVVMVLWGLSSFAVLRSIFVVSERWLLLQMILLIAGGVGILCLAAERRQRPRAVILAMSLVLTAPILFGQIVPVAKTHGRELVSIGKEVGHLVPGDGRLVSVAPEPEPLFSFGSRQTIRNVRSWDALPPSVVPGQQGRKRYVLAREDAVGRPPFDGAENVQTWRLQRGVVWRLWRW